MEILIDRLVRDCIRADFVEENQAEWLRYYLQCKLMNLEGLFILTLFGIMVAPLPQVILLNLSFAFLREKANGLHMPTKLSCFIVSLIFQYLCLFTIHHFQTALSVEAVGMLVAATFLIFMLAPCNNSSVHCDDAELKNMKKALRKRLLIHLFCIAAVYLLNPAFVNTLIVAEFAVAMMVVLAKVGFGIQ